MRTRRAASGDSTITVVWIGWMHLAYLVGIGTGLIIGIGVGVLLA